MDLKDLITDTEFLNLFALVVNLVTLGLMWLTWRNLK